MGVISFRNSDVFSLIQISIDIFRNGSMKKKEILKGKDVTNIF